jgi:DNA repair exonuclease SbcCD ATPase subunit
MRYTGIFCLALSVVLLLLLGCPSGTSPTPTSNSDHEAAKARRDAYAREMSKRLEELNAKYEELNGQAAKFEGQAKQELEKKLEETKVKRDEAAKKLDELKQAGADRWEQIKEGVGSALDNLNESITAAVVVATEATKAMRDAYVRETSKRLEELNAKYEELNGRVAKAEGQAKKELEKKLEEAKVKRDEAAKKLDELKQAGIDRWEKVKEGVGSALEELKKVFE